MSDNRDCPSFWSLWRQDDNGHRFEIARCMDAETAHHALSRYQDTSHKQLFWIEATNRRE